MTDVFIAFVVGFICGGVFGVLTMAICIGAKRSRGKDEDL